MPVARGVISLAHDACHCHVVSPNTSGARDQWLSPWLLWRVLYTHSPHDEKVSPPHFSFLHCTCYAVPFARIQARLRLGHCGVHRALLNITAHFLAQRCWLLSLCVRGATFAFSSVCQTAHRKLRCCVVSLVLWSSSAQRSSRPDADPSLPSVLQRSGPEATWIRGSGCGPRTSSRGSSLGKSPTLGTVVPALRCVLWPPLKAPPPQRVETTTPMWPTITHSPPWQFRPASPWPTTSALATVSTIQHRRALFLSSP
jgi:hypothetical protein